MHAPRPRSTSSYISYILNDLIYEIRNCTIHRHMEGPRPPLKFLLHLLQSYWPFIRSPPTHKHISSTAHTCKALPSLLKILLHFLQSYRPTDRFTKLCQTQIHAWLCVPPLRFLLHLLQSYRPLIRRSPIDTHRLYYTHMQAPAPCQITLTFLTNLSPFYTNLHHTLICRALLPLSNSSYISYNLTDLLYKARPHTNMWTPDPPQILTYHTIDPTFYTELYHTQKCTTLAALKFVLHILRSSTIHRHMHSLGPSTLKFFLHLL